MNATVTCPGCGEKLDVTIEFHDSPDRDDGMFRLGYADHVCSNPQRRRDESR